MNLVAAHLYLLNKAGFTAPIFHQNGKYFYKSANNLLSNEDFEFLKSNLLFFEQNKIKPLEVENDTIYSIVYFSKLTERMVKSINNMKFLDDYKKIPVSNNQIDFVFFSEK